MKRYNRSSNSVLMTEHHAGAWVKYDDAVAHGDSRYNNGLDDASLTECVVKMSKAQVDALFDDEGFEAFLAETTCGRRLYVRPFDEATKAPDDVTPGIHRSVNLEKDSDEDLAQVIADAAKELRERGNGVSLTYIKPSESFPNGSFSADDYTAARVIVTRSAESK